MNSPSSILRILLDANVLGRGFTGPAAGGPDCQRRGHRHGGLTTVAFGGPAANAAGLGLRDRIGTIALGFEADLIALDGNPPDSIEAVRRGAFGMRGGEVLKH